MTLSTSKLVGEIRKTISCPTMLILLKSYTRYLCMTKLNIMFKIGLILVPTLRLLSGSSRVLRYCQIGKFHTSFKNRFRTPPSNYSTGETSWNRIMCHLGQLCTWHSPHHHNSMSHEASLSQRAMVVLGSYLILSFSTIFLLPISLSMERKFFFFFWWASSRLRMQLLMTNLIIYFIYKMSFFPLD